MELASKLPWSGIRIERDRMHRIKIIAFFSLIVFTSPALALNGLSLTLNSYPSKPVSGQILTYQASWRAGTGSPCFGDLIINLPSSGVTFQSSNPGGSYNAGTNQVRWSGIRFHNNRGDRWVRVLVNQAGGNLPTASAQIIGGCSASSGNGPGPDVPPGAQPVLERSSCRFPLFVLLFMATSSRLLPTVKYNLTQYREWRSVLL